MKFKDLFNTGRKPGILNPEQAYDIWAGAYDYQPGNLVLDQETKIFHELLAGVDLEDSSVIDIGCGTGRHWELIYSLSPGSLHGTDVSQRMLDELHRKFPGADARKAEDSGLSWLPDASMDIIISTLALAHFKDPLDILEKWNRVLKANGMVLLTDYHPDLLKSGGERTFSSDGTTYIVESHAVPMPVLLKKTEQLGWKLMKFIERKIDESVRSWYIDADAVHVYEKHKGSPLLYGCLFKKQ
jgi:ubiquinone/menaquinone biosynthesis C-methylase UbiE